MSYDQTVTSYADDGSEASLPLQGVGSRIAIALGVLAFDAIGYNLVGFNTDHARTHSLRLPVDDRIPFWPWTVYLYSWVYTSMLYPLFVVRCPTLFRRTAEAYVLTIGISLAIFAIFPVSSVGLRPDLSNLDLSVFHNWGVALTYFVDPPTNLFPSLHMSVATLAALVAWKARPLYGWLAAPVVLAVALSITTMKQHFVLDGLGAVLVATFAYRARLKNHDADRDSNGPVAYSWRGPMLYLVFHCSAYLAFYAAFRMGFRPWER